MSLIDRLKQKSEKEKKAIAFGVAISATLIIAILWFIAQSAMQGI